MTKNTRQKTQPERTKHTKKTTMATPTTTTISATTAAVRIDESLKRASKQRKTVSFRCSPDRSEMRCVKRRRNSFSQNIFIFLFIYLYNLYAILSNDCVFYIYFHIYYDFNLTLYVMFEIMYRVEWNKRAIRYSCVLWRFFVKPQSHSSND